MAFIDAAKEEYPDYYGGLLRLVRVGGLIAIDNVFMAGGVADPANARPGVQAVRALNERIAADDRVSIAMIPIADGLTLARRER
jgi:O-methyltransferase